MKAGWTAAIAGAACLVGGAGAAHADLEEIRFGVMAHNTGILVPQNGGKEDGVNVHAQLEFSTPGVLRWAFSPRPYVMASVNTAGETSYAAIGLDWRWKFAEGWALEPTLGYAVHDGDIDSPYDKADPRHGPYVEDHLLLGSRDVFRVGFGLTRDLTPRWAAQLQWDHLSHGQILGTGRNEGLDDLGVRLIYKR
ncbi:MAG: hypothetical protein AB7M12_12945 [Hyphomonadaceae bacterium]